MNLKKICRVDLDQKMRSLVCKERELLHELLLVIKEIDGRRLYLEMGYSSLFSYLVEGIGYSEGAAQRRIDAARLLKDIPSLGEKIQDGSVSLSQISLMQKSLREAKKQSINLSADDKSSLLENLTRKSYQQTQKEIALFLDLPVQMPETKSTQADDSVRVTFTLSKELYDKINLAQALLSHSLPNKEISSYLEFITDKVLKQKATGRSSSAVKNNDHQSTKSESQNTAKDSSSQKIGIQPTTTSITKNAPLNTKEFLKITADVAVNKSAGRKKSPFKSSLSPNRLNLANTSASCQFKDPLTGKICRSKWHLQWDHKQARWAGGLDTRENLQVLCQQHNIYKYKKEMGIKYKT